jgi:hypothetical protein
METVTLCILSTISIRLENKNDESEVIFHQMYAVNKGQGSPEDFEYSHTHPCKNV